MLSAVWPLDSNPDPDVVDLSQPLPLSSTFGPRYQASQDRYDWHRGIDILTLFGTPIYAIEDGKVSLAGDYTNYEDRMIRIQHTRSVGPDYYSLYLHLSEIADGIVKNVDVTQGQLIGYSGDTGVGRGTTDTDGDPTSIVDNYDALPSTAGFDHLHFEIRDGGTWQEDAVHPLLILPYADGEGPAGSGVGPAVDVVQLSPGIDDYTGTGFTDSNTLQVHASVMTSPDELDVNRVEVFVYDTSGGGPVLVTQRAVDINQWNLDYTPHPSGSSQIHILDTEPAYDGVYDGDYGAGPVTPAPLGVKIDAAEYRSSSETYQLDVTFFDLQIPEGLHNLSIEVVAADIWGHSNSVNVPLGLALVKEQTPGVKNIVNWTVDGGPLSTLNLPLESPTAPQDFSSLGHPVTVYGATPTVGHDGFGAYYFDGVNDRITVPDHPTLKPADGSFSVSLWVKPDGLQGPQTGLIKQEGDASDLSKYKYWVFELNSDNTMFAEFRDGPAPDDLFWASARTPLTVGEWNHLVYVVDREQQRVNLYLNGQLDGVTSVLFDDAITPVDRPLVIGQHVSNFQGSLDDILVYQRALTSEQVAALFEDDNLRIAPEELRAHEQWQAFVTPHDGQAVGTTEESRIVTIVPGNQPPSLGVPSVVSEPLGTNFEDEALVLTTNGVVDPDGDAVHVITNWTVDGDPLASLYLPFEKSEDPLDIMIRDYSGWDQEVIAGSPVRPGEQWPGQLWRLNPSRVPTFDATSGKGSPGSRHGSGGYVFDGIDDSITVTHDTRLDPGEGSFSVSMWVKPTSGDPRSLIGLARKGGHLVGQEYWILGTDNSGNLSFTIRYNTGANDRVWGWSDTPLTMDEWNHVALVIDRNDGFVKLYVDGQRANANAVSIPVGEGIASTEPMLLGYHGNAFKGAMDEVMVFQRALSPAQIDTMYDQGLSRIEAEETIGGEVWQARQIPHDGRLAGLERYSNALLVLNTPVGDNVVVAPVDKATGDQTVSVTFDRVDTPGATTVVTSPQGPTIDTGFNVLTTYYEVNATATFSDSDSDGNAIQISFAYDENALADNQNESQLKLMHREDTNYDGVVDYRDEWVDRTDRMREFDTEISGEVTFGIDTVNDVIYGLVSSLSPFAIFVPNGPATAIAGGPYLVDEGGSVMLDGSASEDPENDIRVYEWDFDYDGVSFDIDAEGVTAVLDATELDGPLTRDVALRIVDSGNHVDLAMTTVVVGNVAPTNVSISAPVAADEGCLVQLSGTAIDAAGVQDPLSYVWDITKDGAPWMTSSGELIDFTPDDDAEYVINLTVSDHDGGMTTAIHSLIASNLAPVAAIFGPADGVPGETLSFTFSATDASAIDQASDFTYEVDWDGDGTVDEVIVGPAMLVVDHVYPVIGPYTIEITAEDKDGLQSEIATIDINLSQSRVSPEDLVVGGTPLDDTIEFKPGNAPGEVEAILNGQSLGVFTPTGRLIAYGQGGDDQITVNASLEISAWLYGDAGHDRLKGGAGNDLLFGGADDDVLVGNSGRDYLSGGQGADRIVGNSHDDILIGGYSVYDHHDVALQHVMQEWTRPDLDYDTRVANIRGSESGNHFDNRHNGEFFLQTEGPAATVSDDDERDVMTGSSGRDWFFADLAEDKTTDLQSL